MMGVTLKGICNAHCNNFCLLRSPQNNHTVLQVALTFRSLNGDLKIFLVAISEFLVAIIKYFTHHKKNTFCE